MANQIPQKNRQAVYERADRKCEYCGTSKLSNFGDIASGIHHIVKRDRRIHRTENLILLCSKCHTRAEKTEFGEQLRLSLQQHYRFKGYEGEQLRELMGGRLYTRKEVK